MASESVATKVESTSSKRGSKHDLWIADRNVLTICIDKHCSEFPPVIEQCIALNQTIHGLARAAKAVLFHAHNDIESDTEFAADPIKDIQDAIILLSQLSNAILMESSEVTA